MFSRNNTEETVMSNEKGLNRKAALIGSLLDPRSSSVSHICRSERKEGEVYVALYETHILGRADPLRRDPIVDDYKELSANHPEWRLASIYNDSGVSGRELDSQSGFNRMVCEAVSGDIDLIITTKVSKFTDDIDTTAEYLEMLKEHEVNVYFVDDDMWAYGSDGESVLELYYELRPYRYCNDYNWCPVYDD